MKFKQVKPEDIEVGTFILAPSYLSAGDYILPAEVVEIVESNKKLNFSQNVNHPSGEHVNFGEILKVNKEKHGFIYKIPSGRLMYSPFDEKYIKAIVIKKKGEKLELLVGKDFLEDLERLKEVKALV